MIDDQLERWRQSGLIDQATADRIREFELDRAGPVRFRWPMLVALGAGALMVGAGVLLFVAAHWDGMSPAGRLTLLLALVTGFHAGGALLADRLPALATALQAVGTAGLGATIFLTGQTYHLETAWPLGFLLWSLGAWAGYLLLGSWPQALFAALLTPAWLVSEWLQRAGTRGEHPPAAPLAGLLLLSLVYLFGEARGDLRPVPRTLASLGALAFLPLGIFAALSGDVGHSAAIGGLPAGFNLVSWTVAIGGPLFLAWRQRGRHSWPALVAVAWVVAGTHLGRHPGLLAYLWAAIGALGLTASGVHDGSRRRVNLGVAAFALTVVIFYFSNVLDKLGRATALVAGGGLFLGLGWLLERLRRRLIRSTTDPEGP